MSSSNMEYPMLNTDNKSWLLLSKGHTSFRGDKKSIDKLEELHLMSIEKYCYYNVNISS